MKKENSDYVKKEVEEVKNACLKYSENEKEQVAFIAGATWRAGRQQKEVEEQIKKAMGKK